MDEIQVKVTQKVAMSRHERANNGNNLKVILPGKPTNFMEEFRKVIASEPPRTGKPENWPPSKMKGYGAHFKLIGLDTNILCYALDPAYPEHEKLKNLLFNLSTKIV
jgi:hypothetical protein